MSGLEDIEGPLRLGVFLGVFALMAGLEAVWPRRQRKFSRARRWTTNGLIVVIDSVALRVFVPVLAVAMADIAARNSWGLFNNVGLPLWAEFLLTVILLDLAVYAQHVATHRIPILWRVHKVHHVDRDIDVTTGARFHPVEIVISMGFKIICVLALGPAAGAVLAFEVLLNASAMFNHANFRLPRGVDAALRPIIVTPDMHRVHHSVYVGETNSNYGFFLSVWDRIFKTYIAQPQDGHDQMTIGISDHQDDGPTSLLWSLMLPFQRVVPASHIPPSSDRNP